MAKRQSKEDALFRGLLPYIESLPGVIDVSSSFSPPLSIEAAKEWEMTNHAVLPTDFVNFLCGSNGFSLKWISSLYNSKDCLGCMEINSLENTTRREGSKFKDAFCIQNCEPFGSVYMTIPFQFQSAEDGHHLQTGNDIYFLDKESGDWIYITSSFSNYFRLMVSSLGIKGWQLAYKATNKIGNGWSLWTMNWMYFYCKEAATIIANQAEKEKEALLLIKQSEHQKELEKMLWDSKSLNTKKPQVGQAINMDKVIKNVQMWNENHTNVSNLTVELLVDQIKSQRDKV